MSFVKMLEWVAQKMIPLIDEIESGEMRVKMWPLEDGNTISIFQHAAYLYICFRCVISKTC